MRRSFFPCTSQETMRPSPRIWMAAAKLLPPGAAQASSTFMPGSAPEAMTARRAASSWM